MFPGLKLGLPEVDIHAERLERLGDVVGEVRLQLQRTDVEEVVAGIGAGEAGGQIDKVKDAGEVAVRPPVLCEAGE